ncbi:MAG: ABC transporter ATP-binding protein [Deltaproteobacteria bacterium]|nr:ABC transporter ATP-binding protein [Deltaproteobacteria bacterium]
MLRLKNLSKSFKRKRAVENLNLRIQKGELFALLGPTGAGKTTTLRMASGLEKPDSGQVFLDGREVTNLPPQERDISFVFEGLNLIPIYTVYDNIALALRSPIYGEPEEEIRSRIERIARDLRIDHLFDRKPATLSGGEIQRVAIARALIRRPKLYLLDEPLSNLDLKLREGMRAELKELHQRYESTILYATHDYIGAVSIADRIGILHEGKLHQVGTQAELHEDPATTTVASLMGNPAMNLIRVAREGTRLVPKGDSSYSFEMLKVGEVTEGILEDDLLLGVWPEDVQVSLEPRDGFFKSRLYGQEYRGNDRVISIAIGEDEILKKMVESNFPGHYGDACWFALNPDRLYLFNPHNGKRVV